MKTELEYFDVFPRVVPAGVKKTVHVKPRGAHAALIAGKKYILRVSPLCTRERSIPEESFDLGQITPDSDGGFSFDYTFEGEQEHFISIILRDDPKPFTTRLSVYSLYPDLYALRPYKGDFHVHTYHSDGKESPAVVCSNYRKAGFDFTCITDHRKFKPSVEAIEAFKDAPIDLTICTGEEIHCPDNHVHLINFGSSFSVNEYFQADEERYFREVSELADTLEVPENIDKFIYASCVWTFNKTREGGGLAIYAHPHWVTQSQYNVCDAMSEYLFKTKPFDAFELLNGMFQYENNVQTAFYHEMREKGYSVPVVGSSDCHGTINANNFNWFRTYVFAKSNTRDDIIDAVRAGMSTALEQYPGEYPRSYGSYRLARYSVFLTHNYFPVHDELCFEEGRAMRDYINGDRDEAVKVLNALRGRTAKYMQKVFG